MPIIHKTTAFQDLAQYQTWIVDENPTSRYFQLSQIPDVLTAGKNAFLINGSPELSKTTEVLVELVDVNGNAVFLQPVRNYLEGLARLVSIEIYDSTPIGMGTLTILGHLDQDEQGNRPPDNFINSYNVKWQTRIMISPYLGNKTPIRLERYPTASVMEILNPFREATQSLSTVTGSVALNIAGFGQQSLVNLNTPLTTPYVVVASTSSFVKSMEGGTLMATINSQPFTSSITTVINNTTAQISPGYVSASIYPPFSTSTFKITYTNLPRYTLTESTRSFANVTLNNLSTFSGDIRKVKIFVSSIDSPGNQDLIADANVESAELLVTSSYTSGQPLLRTGDIVDNTIVSQYWVCGAFSTDSADY